MPIFVYLAKTDPQNTIEGEIEAESVQEAINKIGQVGYFPISVTPKVKNSRVLNKTPKKISKHDIVLFIRQLSTLVDSGVPIVSGLNIVMSQMPNLYLKEVLGDVVGRIKDGKSFSDSLATHPEVFPRLYTAIINSGEVSGSLKTTLTRLADFLEKEEEFRNSVRLALVYPAFVFCVGVLTVIVLIGFVIPRLVNMFEDMGQVLPLPTKILIEASVVFSKYWIIIIALALVVIFFLRRLYLSPPGRLAWDKFKLKLMVLGEITLKTEISRLTRTLSLLLSGGLSLVPSLDIVSSILENRVLKLETSQIKADIIGGLSLSNSMKKCKLFPNFVTNIVIIGEETGTLKKSLMRIADDYERDVDRSLKSLARMLEPVIILGVGLVVGFIVLAMLLPIFQINLIAR
ncbi:MAG: type II secretion system F family protein [Candidatus Omnitrophica bacterium]|nr:type II secretion system F family protein [Candidatus Omnitrophota bacterium]